MSNDDLIAELELENNMLRARNERLEKEATVFEEDGFVESIHELGYGGTHVLTAGAGYTEGVDVLCRIEDTGNGYIAYFPSYSSAIQDNYICMDYSEADYLRKLLTHLHIKRNNV